MRPRENEYTSESLEESLSLLESYSIFENISSCLALIERQLTRLEGKQDLNQQIERLVRVGMNRKFNFTDYMRRNTGGSLIKFLQPYPLLLDFNVRIALLMNDDTKTELDRCKLLEECVSSSNFKASKFSESVIQLILSIKNSYSVLKIAEKNRQVFNDLLRHASTTDSAQDFYLIFSCDGHLLDIDIKCTYYRLKYYNNDPNSLMELLTGCLNHFETSKDSAVISQCMMTLFALFKDETIDTRLAERKFVQVAASQKAFVNRYLLGTHNTEVYTMLKTSPDLLDVQVTAMYFEDTENEVDMWDSLITNLVYLSSTKDGDAKMDLILNILTLSQDLREKDDAALFAFAEEHKYTINQIHRDNTHNFKLGGILSWYPTILDIDVQLKQWKTDYMFPSKQNVLGMLTTVVQELKKSSEEDHIQKLLPEIDSLLDRYTLENVDLREITADIVDYATQNKSAINKCLRSSQTFSTDGLLKILMKHAHVIETDTKIKFIDIAVKGMSRDSKWELMLEFLESFHENCNFDAIRVAIYKLKRSFNVICEGHYKEFAEANRDLINRVMYLYFPAVQNNSIFDLIKFYPHTWSVEVKIKFAGELIAHYDEEEKWALVKLCVTDPDSLKNNHILNGLKAIVKNLFHKTTSNVTDEETLNSFIENYPDLIRESIHISDISPKILPMVIKNIPSFNFDVKLDYLHARVMHSHHNHIRIDIDRNNIVTSSFAETSMFTDEDWRDKFIINFINEEGVDCGGLTREWFTILSREMFNPNYVLFTTAPGDPNSYMINKASHVNPEHLDYFKFFGRIIAKSIIENQRVHCNFTKAFYKQILNIPVECSDFESQDPMFFKSMYFMLKHPTEQLNMDLTFSTEVQEFGETIVKDLVDNGRNIPVTDENKEEYVKLTCHMKMTESIKEQLEAFRQGFNSIIPHNIISMFTPDELEILIAGQPNVDVNNLEANTEYRGYAPTDEHILWFWRALKSFNVVERSKFLMFTTGSPNAPLHGFGALLGSSGVQKFTISKDDRVNRLPTASTCINRLSLPQYDSYGSMRAAILTAIEEGTEGFHVI